MIRNWSFDLFKTRARYINVAAINYESISNLISKEVETQS